MFLLNIYRLERRVNNSVGDSLIRPIKNFKLHVLSSDQRSFRENNLQLVHGGKTPFAETTLSNNIKKTGRLQRIGRLQLSSIRSSDPIN